MFEGISYDGKIVSVSHNANLHVHGRYPVIVGFTYRDIQGQTYLVKSDNLYNMPKMEPDKLRATIYVNREHPRDYCTDVQFAPASDGGLSRICGNLTALISHKEAAHGVSCAASLF